MAESSRNFIGRKFYSSQARGSQLARSVLGGKGFRTGSSGRSRREYNQAYEEEQARQAELARQAEVRRQQEQQRLQAEREARAARIREATLVGQVTRAAQQTVSRGNLVEVGGSSRAGRALKKLPTKGRFIEGEVQKNIDEQIAEFRGLTPKQVEQRLKDQDTRYAGMSTNEGEVITFTPDYGSARAYGEQQFENLPRGQKNLREVTSGLVGAGRAVVSTAEAPFLLGATAIGASGGKGKQAREKVQNIFDTFEPVRELKAIPSDSALRAGEITTSVGLLVPAGEAGFARYAATRGLPKGERALSVLEELSPIKFRKSPTDLSNEKFIGTVRQFVDPEKEIAVTFTEGTGVRTGSKVRTVQVSKADETGQTITKGFGSITYATGEGRGVIRTDVFGMTAKGKAIGRQRTEFDYLNTKGDFGVDLAESKLYRDLETSAARGRSTGVFSTEENLFNIVDIRKGGPKRRFVSLTAEEPIMTSTQRNYQEELFKVFGEKRTKASSDLFAGAGKRVTFTGTTSDTGFSIVTGSGVRRPPRTTPSQSSLFTATQEVTQSTKTRNKNLEKVFFPSFAKASEASRPIQRSRSSGAFAGLGLYERTSSLFGGGPSQSPRSAQRSFSLFATTQGQGQKNRQGSGYISRQGQDLFQPPRQDQRTILFGATETPFADPGNNGVPYASFFGGRGLGGGEGLLFGPGIGNLTDSGLGRGRRGARTQYGVNPSFTAITLGITGRTRFKAGSPLLGLDIRPIESGRRRGRRRRRR